MTLDSAYKYYSLNLDFLCNTFLLLHISVTLDNTYKMRCRLRDKIPPNGRYAKYRSETAFRADLNIYAWTGRTPATPITPSVRKYVRNLLVTADTEEKDVAVSAAWVDGVIANCIILVVCIKI